MKLLSKLSIIACLAYSSATAQIAVSADPVGGTPMTGQVYMNVKGSPYLLEDWQKGSVTIASRKKFENLNLMFDQVANQVIFKDADGVIKSFNQPIVAFSIGEGSKIYNFEKAADGLFYEKLVSGKLNLWKKNKKSIIDEKPYGSATVQRNVLNNTTYYVGELAQLTKIKNDKKSVVQIMSDRASDVEEYIKEQKLNPKNEADLFRIFLYYNGL